MSALLPLSLALAAAVWFVRGSSGVMEITSVYSCCKTPTIAFDPRCNSHWTINNKAFAYSNAASQACKPPCKTMEAGLITLDECLAVNVTIVCTTEMNAVVEKRIKYCGQPCSGSPVAGRQASPGLPLLAAVIRRLFARMMEL